MAAVTALGWHAVALPALRAETILRAALPVRGVQAILVTSGQAVTALAGRVPADMPVLAVGAATARRARAAGFVHVTAAEGTAEALADLVRAEWRPSAGALLLATAPGYGMDLVTALRGGGFRVVRRCVYRIRPGMPAPEALRAMIGPGGVDAALFFSAETARQFLRHLPRDVREGLRSARAIAISDRAAGILGAAPWREIVRAATPDQAAMLDLLGVAGEAEGSAAR
ncbi:uroporphyrinogen-III synthase [Gluconacetobacter takamatsuzukensis]|uniref:Uroporphyrinogen-III synthase n=2 Tax=Gluconacetobacter takamatsuzukensis TaxID=1286190 RepID=A0A7W4PNQ9_9PROT|nr:uroporphyrinogen-III synthase [Gluconacetobacter takamatsuzukensis]